MNILELMKNRRIIYMINIHTTIACFIWSNKLLKVIDIVFNCS